MEEVLRHRADGMHILIVSQYFWPEEFRINDLASELVGRGHKVTVLTGTPNYPMGRTFPDYKRNPEKYSKYNGVDIIRVPLLPRGEGAFRLLLNYASFVLSGCSIGYMKVRRTNFDVIFSPQLSPITAMLPAIMLRKFRKRKFAMWVLDVWPDTLDALGVIRSPKILAIVGKLVRFIYNRTDKIFVQSKGFIANVHKYSRTGVEVEYLSNWSEEIPDLGCIERSPLIENIQGSFDLMFAGAIGESQDFGTILDAAELLKDEPALRWHIVGDGRVSEWVKDETDRRGLHNFFMYGRHPVNTMPSFYKCADVMLVSLRSHPIFAMTIPGKIQSYMAAGKPVLAILEGEGANVVKSAEAGLCVKSGDAKGLAQAIRSMMQMNNRALEEMGTAAKAYSDREFNRKTLIDRIESSLLNLSN